MTSTSNWFFIDENGTFRLPSPGSTSSLYLPLVNRAGLMSCVTPDLQGDIKTGQHSFLTRPVSVEDLHESRAARNFWVVIDGFQPWSATGSSALQNATRYQEKGNEQVELEAGILWQKITRYHPGSGMTAVATSFVPQNSDQVELLKVTLTNTGSNPLQFSATFAVPIFGRSADQLRDHRHVTSLLNVIEVTDHGVVVQPTLQFDETGHHPNQTCYAVLGSEGDSTPPEEIFPLVDQFIGEGGTLDWPECVVNTNLSPFRPGQILRGSEALGGLRFKKHSLNGGDSVSFIIILGISNDSTRIGEWVKKYCRESQFERYFEENAANWKNTLDQVRIKTASTRLDNWTRWVSLQPILRQLFGNSFLPYHDYGRGGRGWRDLWQDILGLLLMQPENVGELLESNFAGIRFDGSNATIIGHEPGEFIADRNDIPRVWMDHGAWPLFTTQLYIDWTGDLEFLLHKQPYFKDHLTHRSLKLDPNWSADQGTRLKDRQGGLYLGSIFEHLLIQNLVQFFNVGDHNCIRLEGADWNDALDMAAQQGESVAFTSFYAGNLSILAQLAELLKQTGKQDVTLAEELTLLLDSLYEPIDYDGVAEKQDRLTAYFNATQSQVTGKQIQIELSLLASDLQEKASWMKKHLQDQEWIDAGDQGWFNGYYDNQGNRIEGIFDNTIQMTLTGQVFPLMFEISTEQQAQAQIASVNQYLYDPQIQGVRLNTEFKYHTEDLGRVFGFAYGHKENGAMFSHMAVMYAFALFQRKFYRTANQLLDNLYQQCQDFSSCRIYPGIPEYIDPSGRGRYPYLTGSASWYILTLISQVFGIQGRKGNLYIRPALNTSWLDKNGQASVQTQFAGRQLRFVIHNPSLLEPDQLVVERIERNNRVLPSSTQEDGLLINRQVIQKFSEKTWHQLDVYLGEG